MNCRGSVPSNYACDSDVLDWLKRYRYWLLVPVVLFMAAIGWRYAPILRDYASDPASVQALVLRLGWLGPFALVALNALQIVFAPIPGYVVQVAAGFLYGPVWGGIWGSLGMLAGASLAFWLARIFGRPLAERLVGRSRLDKWETVTHSTSTAIWFILLLGPTGDLPYFLAGLSRVGFAKIIAITALLRVPAVFLAAAAGATALPWWQLTLIYAVLAAMAGVFMLYQNRFHGWMRESQEHAEPEPGLEARPLQTHSIDSLSMDLNRDNS